MELKVKFDSHGLGDCCHFAQAIQLWRRRGYDVTVQGEQNKRPLWEAAGVRFVGGGDLPNHGWGYPQGFEDLEQPDWISNKVAHGLMDSVMPSIGTQRELWEELITLRMSASDLITDEVLLEATSFLQGLPRPIACIHTRGTNWSERKSLPVDVAFDTVLGLLDAGCSVVSLDFDGREPIVGHERCRGIVPRWGMISIDRMIALYSLCDVLIGVDSGPLHLASYSDIDVLGVFREIHPVRCCLPNPRATYYVSGLLGDAWADREEDWNFSAYDDVEPTAAGIVAETQRILDGTAPLAKISEIRECDIEAYRELSGRYTYRRLEYDERPLHLFPNGLIGRGAAGRERRWQLRDIQDRRVLTIHGDSTPTCHLERQDDGAWRGHWLHAERMQVELTKEKVT